MLALILLPLQMRLVAQIPHRLLLIRLEAPSVPFHYPPMPPVLLLMAVLMYFLLVEARPLAINGQQVLQARR